MEIKGFIFDLDGVICTTDEFHFLSWKAIADQEGIEFNREINNRLRGVSRMDSLNIILEKAHRSYTQEEKNALAEKKNNIYRSYLQTMSKDDVSKGCLELLSFLKEKGIKTAIGSSSKNTKTILEKIGLLNAFDAIVDGTMISHSKPDPEVFLKAAQLLSLTNKECIVIEDAEAGIDAAKNGGFLAAGIGPASHYKRTDYPIKGLLDLKSIFD
jgi:beta-phosphoglucomutase